MTIEDLAGHRPIPVVGDAMYQESALRYLLPGTRESFETFRTTAFRRWEDRASVRCKPQRRLEESHDGVFFTPELYPVCDHPIVAAQGPRARHFLLVRRLHDYLNFTTELETLAVIPVASMISRGRSGLPLSKLMQGDAYKIVTDEAWHAQFSYDLAENVQHATGIAGTPGGDGPAFLHRLDSVRDRMPAHLRGVEALLFSIVSETLISGVLSKLPSDERLPRPVRELIRDHAEDEGRHHAYFRTVLRALWHVLTPAERVETASLVPSVIYAFLEPDYKETIDALRTIGLTTSQVEQVIGETWSPGAVAAQVASGAAPLLRYLDDLGAFDSHRVVETLHHASLMPINGSG